MKALLIGSISTLADTSELQRAAFNQAFEDANLGWHWPQDEYRDMLNLSGGRDRIASYAASTGDNVDSAAVHARKTEIFQENLAKGVLPVRPETAKILDEARQRGWKLGFVSGTDKGSIDALLNGYGGAREMGFSLVTSADDATAPKPDPALYRFALEQLGIDASDALAIEDNRPGVEAAQAAGIEVLAYPNINTADHDFSDVAPITSRTHSSVA